MTSIDVSRLESLVGYNLKRAFNAVKADLGRTLEPFGLRMMTYSTLVLITDNPGLQQAKLADALDMERPNLVAIIDDLERRKLVSRDSVPGDRRARALVPTKAGQTICKRANEAVVAHEASLFAGLGGVGMRDLLQALVRANKALSRGERT